MLHLTKQVGGNMSDAFTSANMLLAKLKLLIETVEQKNDENFDQYYQTLFISDGTQYVDHLLSEDVILNLTETEFDFLKNQRDVYLKMYELPSKDIQQKIMKIKNNTLAELQAEFQQKNQQNKGFQLNFESEEIKISLIDIAKKVLPIKFEDIVEEHKKFVFTIGLRDELFIRFTHNKKAPETQWNRALTLEEKKELHALVWTLTEPYAQQSPHAVSSCRRFCQDALALPDNFINNKEDKEIQIKKTEKLSQDKIESQEYFLNMQQCIEHIKFLCIQSKTQEECAISIKPNSKDSLVSLFFSPREWISPRTKTHINQAVFCDFLIFELEAILSQKDITSIEDLSLFLEKFSLVHQLSFNAEQYPDIFKLMPHMLTEISKCFKIEEDELNELMYKKLIICKEGCKNQTSHHGGYSTDKIEAWIKPNLAHMSPKLISEFSALIYQFFSEENVSKPQKTLVL